MYYLEKPKSRKTSVQVNGIEIWKKFSRTFLLQKFKVFSCIRFSCGPWKYRTTHFEDDTLRPMQPWLGKHHRKFLVWCNDYDLSRLFTNLFQTYVGVQWCTMVYDKDESGHAPRSTPLVWEILINCQWNAVGWMKELKWDEWEGTKDKWSLTANPFQVSE